MNSFKFALLGHNIGYSKSMDIFNAIYQNQKIHGECVVCNLNPETFDEEFKNISVSDITGMSVTIPYKNRVIQFLDDIDPVAKAIEAVNSIQFTNGKLIGYNTDCYGFSKPLRKHAAMLKHGNALILGAGGAAKAVVYALYTDYEIRNFTIVARDIDKLQMFADSIKKITNGINFTAATYDSYHFNQRFDIIVNCTPLGGWNFPDNTPIPKSTDVSESKIYYDLNYNDNNKLIASAIGKCLHVFDGSSMLTAQALRSFFLWTGVKVDYNAIYPVVFKR